MVPISAPLGFSEKKGRLVNLVSDCEDDDVPRLKSGIPNLDRLFGGDEDPGIPCGVVIQLAGNPGIGKSTLLAQVAGGPLCDDILYVASEEKIGRIGRRAKRLRMKNALNIQVIETRSLNTARKAIEECKAKIVIIDSLQGLRLTDGDEDENGELKLSKHTQQTVRDIAVSLISVCHKRGCTVILVGHMNKQETMAGLKEIEHLVDIVCFFKGNPNRPSRHLVCSKNREGDTFYKAWFSMTGYGLMSVKEPSKEELEADKEERIPQEFRKKKVTA